VKIPSSQNPMTPTISSSSVMNAGVKHTSTVPSVAVSDRAPAISAAGRIASGIASGDVRMDKVASIRAALQSGSYSVEPSAVASKLVASMLDRAS
jgi:flagellar biosynthesis anti-sigma factor FlgM